jgi:hypothetical protein
MGNREIFTGGSGGSGDFNQESVFAGSFNATRKETEILTADERG